MSGSFFGTFDAKISSNRQGYRRCGTVQYFNPNLGGSGKVE